jgi:hypothetical protein
MSQSLENTQYETEKIKLEQLHVTLDIEKEKSKQMEKDNEKIRLQIELIKLELHKKNLLDLECNSEQVPSRKGSSWNFNEEEKLLQLLSENVDIKEISINFGRTDYAIKCRFNKIILKLFLEEELSLEDIYEETKLTEEKIKSLLKNDIENILFGEMILSEKKRLLELIQNSRWQTLSKLQKI